MTAIAVLVLMDAGALGFMVHVFVALCRERRAGGCHVVHILREPEQCSTLASSSEAQAFKDDARSEWVPCAIVSRAGGVSQGRWRGTA